MRDCFEEYRGLRNFGLSISGLGLLVGMTELIKTMNVVEWFYNPSLGTFTTNLPQWLRRGFHPAPGTIVGRTIVGILTNVSTSLTFGGGGIVGGVGLGCMLRCRNE